MKVEDLVIDYKPEPNQEIVHQDEHRYKVVCAGRKFGKSVLARSELWMRAFFDYKEEQKKGVYQPGNFWIVSPTIKQGKQNHWRQLLAEIPRAIIKKTNHTELQIQLINNAYINIVGAENADKIRGAGVKGMVVDEAAYISSKVWEMVLEPELLSTKGWALFISTPKGYNWFEELWKKGQKEKNKFWKSWRFTSFDTPRAKDPLRKQFLDDKQKNSAVETFAQEYLADFTKLEGLIYKEFDKSKHLVEPQPPAQDSLVFRCIDFGTKNPVACLWVEITADKRIIVFDEIYETDLTTADLADMMRSKSFGMQIEDTFADPSAAQWILELNDTYKIPTTPATRETKTTKTSWVQLGIDKVKEKLIARLKDGMPQLQITQNCENLIREIQLYSWKKNPDPDKNAPGSPEKANDHALDALRYFMISWEGTTFSRDYKFPEQNLFKKGGFY